MRTRRWVLWLTVATFTTGAAQQPYLAQAEDSTSVSVRVGPTEPDLPITGTSLLMVTLGTGTALALLGLLLLVLGRRRSDAQPSD